VFDILQTSSEDMGIFKKDLFASIFFSTPDASSTCTDDKECGVMVSLSGATVGPDFDNNFGFSYKLDFFQENLEDGFPWISDFSVVLPVCLNFSCFPYLDVVDR
jgi:hypothetical protein